MHLFVVLLVQFKICIYVGRQRNIVSKEVFYARSAPHYDVGKFFLGQGTEPSGRCGLSMDARAEFSGNARRRIYKRKQLCCLKKKRKLETREKM